MRELVQQLLAFSLKTQGPQVPVRLGPVLEEAVADLLPDLPAAVTAVMGRTCERDRVIAGFTQLRRVVRNLVTNAVQALPPAGTV